MFNLFKLFDQRGLKRRIYESELGHGGGDHYFADHKEVRGESSMGLWPDRMTLYVCLHRSANATGSVGAARILQLDVTELTRLLSTLWTTHTEPGMGIAVVIVRLGRFFLGQLDDR